jgi:hypothetical protein
MTPTGARCSARSKLFFLVGAIAAAAVCVLLPSALAATPADGTLTDTSGPVTYTAGPFPVANPTPVPLVDSGPECLNPAQPCDDFALTVSLPSGYASQNPNKVIRFSASWADTGAGVSDYDLYVYQGSVATTDGSEAPYTKSASGANPELAAIPVFEGTRTFTVKVVPYTPTAETVNVSVELADVGSSGGGGTTTTAFGGPTATAPGVPRYQIMAPPPSSSANSGSGEFNIGFDPKTGNIMTNSWGDVFRVTPPELRSPALPEAGPAVWRDVSPSIASATTLDPILVTDQATGRTFVSNFTAGASALFAWTDDDGATWTQASAAPPNGGVDHQSLGVGPYPAALGALGTVYPNAVYYCSQADVPDMCQRSDSGGLEFGPGVVANDGLTACGGLHGHLRVAPDGTVYLPGKDCGGSEGGAVSTNAGTTWSSFLVPNSGTSNSDPSIGTDKDNTAYYCYTPNDGSAHVAVSHDGGSTWTDDYDLGASVGVKQAVFPEAVAGDSGRAACGFLGTDKVGDLQSQSFPGKWYLYIATTYDGGKTWTTVNATPNDPVQGAGGICLGGLGCGSNRNLLDFNEVTIDDRGRVLFGYDDGCVTDRCIQSGGDQNDFVAYARVARQTGGNPLYAKDDPVEPAAPKQPYLSGTRNSSGATLHWSPGDNGGSDVTSYRILRGTSSGAEAQVATVSGDKTQYLDTTVDPAVSEYDYEVVAVNAIGASPASNEVVPETVADQPVETPCTPPGLTVLTDAAGDSLTGTAGTDLHSLQVSEPYAPDGNVALRFQLNTDPGTTPQPPGSYWYVSFKVPDGSVHGVRMWWDPTSPAAPTFQSYVAQPNTSGGVDGRFAASGSTKPVDPRSSYDAASGTIVIWAAPADLGLSAGDTITGFNAASAQEASTPVGGGAEVLDGMPDSLAYMGSFDVQANAQCSSDTAPTAALGASPTSGTAPLAVAFDASASSDADQGDSVASYTFDFGDGSATVTQSTPTISHTYEQAGSYVARLTVTDSHGASSTNDAVVGIAVTSPPVCFEDDDAHIAYDSGWHSVSDSGATAGHVRTSNGKGLSFSFSTATDDATLTYDYATSTKGGSADLWVDGTFAKTVSFQGASGKLHSPAYGASLDLQLAGGGSHTFELRNASGGAYVDRICVTEGSSQAQPQSSPGKTSALTQDLEPAGELVEKVVVPAGATALSVLTESTSVSIPMTVVVIDPDGNAIGKASTSKLGIASLDVPVSKAGTYLVQVLDAGLGPVEVWSAVTPQMSG